MSLTPPKVDPLIGWNASTWNYALPQTSLFSDNSKWMTMLASTTPTDTEIQGSVKTFVDDMLHSDSVKRQVGMWPTVIKRNQDIAMKTIAMLNTKYPTGMKWGCIVGNHSTVLECEGILTKIVIDSGKDLQIFIFKV
jgi:hypothetical protein